MAMDPSPPVEEGAEEEPEPGQQVRLRRGRLEQVRVVWGWVGRKWIDRLVSTFIHTTTYTQDSRQASRTY